MKLSEKELKSIHRLSNNNLQYLTQKLWDAKCRCFFCKGEFIADDIKEFVGTEGEEALCPKCGIDSVIPVHMLEEQYQDDIDGVINCMYEYWFSELFKLSQSNK